MSELLDWCPTQGGTFIGYAPEWLDGKEWKKIRTESTRNPLGLPQPLYLGGITQTLGLFGHAQAHALAWSFAAHAAADGNNIEVRVAKYEIVYDIKARKI